MKLLAFLLLSLYIFGVSTQRKKSTTKKPKKESCMRRCFPKYFNPVCGNNGKCNYQFYNICLMYNLNCQNNKIQKPVFKLIVKGECYSDYNRCKTSEI